MNIQDLADEALRTFLRWEPLAATLYGLHDLGVDGELADWSEAGAARQRTTLLDLQQRLESEYAPEELPLQERLTHDMLSREVAERLEWLDTAQEEFAVAPFAVGAQAQLLQMLPKANPARADLADARLERLSAIPAMLRQAADRLGTGVDKGRTPPARAARGAIAQIEAYLASPADGDALIGVTPSDLADPAAWEANAAKIVEEQVRPAFVAFRDHIRDVVLPRGRSDDQPGLAHLGDGAHVYDVLVRHHTSTDRSPDDIHELGRGIIARLDEEYAELGARVLGVSGRAEVFARLRSDEELRYSSGEQMVEDARRAITAAVDASPGWFGLRPDAACDVREVGPLEAPSAPPAYYTPPATDGSRPGVYWINTFQPETRHRYLSESIAFHEAVPGHHFQLSLAQSLEELPLYRRISVHNAYAEGWGLYAERLAEEMGLYSSDIMRLGVVATDSWRACRLVVDTGLHHLGWSRQEAIDFMFENSPTDLATIEVEVDRYIGMPGQALGYMVGRIEIVRLREEAERRLGDRFDVRGFHDAVLGSGSLPLSTLGLVVDDWVERTAADA